MAKKQDGFKQPETAPEKTPQELILEQVEQKAADLGLVYKCKVHPIVFYDPDTKDMTDPIIGYLKDPERMTKIRILDKASQIGDFAASSELIELCLLKEESDHRIYASDPAFDKFYLGACFQAQQILNIAINQFKKK